MSEVGDSFALLPSKLHCSEFNTVFFDALDRNLQVHPHGEPMRRLIQEQFEVTNLTYSF